MSKQRILVVGEGAFANQLREQIARIGAGEVDSAGDDFWDTLSLGRLQRHDCVVTVTGDPESLLRLNQMCLIVAVDLVVVALDDGRLVVECFPFGSSAERACVECHFADEAYRQIAERYTSAGLRRVGQPPVAAAGSTGPAVPDAVAAAAEAPFSLRNDPRPPARRLVISAISGASELVDLERSTDCAGCEPFQMAPRIVRTRNRWCARVEGIPGDRRLVDQTLHLSDRLITRYECGTCGPLAESALYVNHRANEFDESIATCPRCGTRAVQVEIRDTFTLGELMERFGSTSAPVKYATTNTPDGPVCFDLEAGGS
ncbi:MAG: hypothetical protein WBO04_10240 [Steroidobacteraceae bacterium]